MVSMPQFGKDLRVLRELCAMSSTVYVKVGGACEWKLFLRHSRSARGEGKAKANSAEIAGYGIWSRKDSPPFFLLR